MDLNLSMIFLDFFSSNLYISPWFRKSFKFMVLRLLANTSASHKIETVQFTHAPRKPRRPQVLIITPPKLKEITHSSWTAFSEDLFFLHQKGRREGLWSWKNDQNQMCEVLVTILINSTIFALCPSHSFLIYCAII